ncbi:MAG: hypothetical protein RLZZ157_959, partial [Pseudomonadota bacterium]
MPPMTSPNTLTSADVLRFLPKAQDDTLRRVALIGTLPPKRCGIATFTADVQRSLNAVEGWACEVFALVDDMTAGDNATASRAIGRDTRADYGRAAARIQHSGYDIVAIQHEFGIFGGDNGDYILDLVRGLTCPIIVTMHTVIAAPSLGQRLVVASLLRHAAHVIVMAQKGADLLVEIYGADPSRISVCPHGTPDRPFCETGRFKQDLGLSGRQVLLTFGLLSPGKGLETMIAAMPEVVSACPHAIYVILGATHPNLLAQEGEAYRAQLVELVRERAMTDHIIFVDAFVDDALLLDYLGAADIYVTPYLNAAQVTSGTLAYAIALGKPVVSTPFWHALEWVDETTGALVDFGDVAGFAGALIGLLDSPDQLAATARAAYARGRPTIWARSGAHYVKTFEDAMADRAPLTHVVPLHGDGNKVSLRGVIQATDSCGIMQHSTYGIDNRAHGYCIDDNVRALILVQRLRRLGHRGADLDDLERIYGAFVQHAWNGQAGGFRNFMGYGRNWLEAVGSDDSNGRTFWALGEVALSARDPDIALWARELAKQIGPSVAALTSLRAQCFVILGADAFLRAMPDDPFANALLSQFSEALLARYVTHASPDWVWLEPSLSYDNARVPQALIVAGDRLSRLDMLAAGLRALSWLDHIQRAPCGSFRAVGSLTPNLPYAPPTIFDQQPIEACASIDAALAAYHATHQVKWLRAAKRAHAWFFGENELGLSLADHRGGCFDGLTPL